MPWQEITARTFIACVVLTAAFFIYARLLLLIGQRSTGFVKLIVGLFVYLLFAAVLGGSLIYLMLSAPEPDQRQGSNYVLGVFAGWALALTPGVLHLRSQLHSLRRNGFFRPVRPGDDAA